MSLNPALEEITLADVREADFQVAVIPLGATEPHNLHLPYGTDTFESDEMTRLGLLRSSGLVRG